MKITTKRQIILMYSILFFVFCMITFYPFYKNGISLVWGQYAKDGLVQHFNAVAYWGEYLRECLVNFLHGKFSLPMWDMSIGYGGDILTTLNYYAIGDPLNLIYIFSNKHTAEYFYDFAVILRMYLIGISFICYGWYMKKESHGILFGSFVYLFSGFVFKSALRHPFFLNPMIYLPLLFLGVEKIYRKERPYLFMGTVTVAAMSNFYFFYMLTAVTVIYALIRFPSYKEHGFFKTLGRFFGWYMLGIGLSAVILCPVILGFMGNARNASAVNYFTTLFYPKAYYMRIFIHSIGYENVVRGTSLNYAALTYFAVIVLFLQNKKEKRGYQVAALTAGACLICPVFSYILHGFSYPMNRWVFAVALLAGIIVMEMYPDLLSLNRIQKIGILAGAILYVLASGCSVAGETRGVRLAVVMMAVTVMVLFAVNDMAVLSEGNRKHFVMLGLLTLSVSAAAYVNLSQSMSKVINEYLPSGMAYEMLCGNKMKLLTAENKKTENLYRTDTINATANNWGLIDHVPGTSNYWSITDGNVSETLHQFGLLGYQYKFKFQRLDQRQGLLNLFGVKYVIGNPNVNNQIPEGFQQIKKTGGISLYENQKVLPFGYTYDRSITKKEYAKLNALEKEQAMLRYAVMEDEQTDNSERISNETYTKVIDVGGNYTFQRRKRSQRPLEVKIPQKYLKKNSYLYLQGIQGFGVRNKSRKHMIDLGKNYNGIHMEFQGKKFVGVMQQRYSTYDTGSRDYVLKIQDGKISQKGNETLIVKFMTRGDYRIDKISVVQVDGKAENQAIEKLRKNEHLTNIEYDGGNHFSGNIKVKDSKILCIPIPYSKGWSATDNGEKVELEKVNGMFLGLKLSKGSHHLQLDYVTPGIKAGAILTIVSVLILGGIWVYRRQNSRFI